MRLPAVLLGAAVVTSGCSTSAEYHLPNPANESTVVLCRSLATSTDENYRYRLADLLTRRGVTLERCNSLIAGENQIAAGIAVAAAGVAIGAAAANGGGYYSPSSYGVAWDQFYNQYYQVIWRCRDKATGQFVDDYHCSVKPMVDSTWPGWSA